MSKKTISLLLTLCLLTALLAGCGGAAGTSAAGDFAHPDYDKDFSTLRTPGSQESASPPAARRTRMTTICSSCRRRTA